MVKNFFFIIFLFSLTLFKPINVSADYQSSRLEYQTSYSTYRDALLQYRTSRSEYITYKTLEATNRAIAATQNFLLARHQVAISYLSMIESRLDITETPYIDMLQAQTLGSEITKLRELFHEQVPLIRNVSTLDNLTELAKDTDKLLNTMDTIGYKTQALVIDSRVKEYINNMTNFQTSTVEQVRRIAVEGKMSTSKFERWVIDTQQKNILANDTYNTANSTIIAIRGSSDYQNTRAIYLNAKQYTQEGNRYLLEILRNIKIKQ